MTKKSGILLIIAYITIFLAIGIYSFYRYAFNQNTTETIEANNIAISYNDKIYISDSTQILQIDNNEKNTTTKLVEGSGLGKFSVFKDKVAYENLSSNITDIYLKNDTPEKILSNSLPGLGNFTGFKSPQFSPDGQKIFAIGESASNDSLVSVKTNDIADYTNWLITKDKIIDYQFVSDALVVIQTKSLSQTKILTFELNTQKTSELLADNETETISEICVNANNIYFIKKSGNLSRLYKYVDNKTELVSAFNEMIADNLNCNQKFLSFNLSSSGSSDLYLINNDGTNLIQQTSGGKANFNTISGNDLFYVYDKKVLYKKTLNKKSTKLYSSQNDINHLVWRPNE